MSSEGLDVKGIIERITRIRDMLRTTARRGDWMSVLIEADRLTRDCLEDLTDGSITLDANLIIRSLSPSASSLFRGNPHAVPGRGLFAAFPWLHTRIFAHQLSSVASNGSPTSFVARAGDSPSTPWLEWRVFPVEDGLEIFLLSLGLSSEG